MKSNRVFLKMTILMAAGLWVLSACSPSVTEKQFENPKTQFNPRYEDIDVRQGNENNTLDFTRIVSMDGVYSPSVLHRLMENILVIGAQAQSPAMDGVAQRLYQKWLMLPESHRTVELKASPYVELAIAQTEQRIIVELENADSEIRQGTGVLQTTLKSTSHKHTWPTGLKKIDAATESIAVYLEKYSQELAEQKLYGPLKEAVLTELATQKEWVRGLGKKLAAAVMNLKKLGDLIRVLEDTIVQEKIQIPENLTQTLNQGKEIALGLESCHSAQGALAVIVDVWSLLDEEQRETYFKPVNADLYKLLKGRSRKDLKCLKEPNCGGVLRDLVKSLFILPKLEAYGVDKICRELNDQSLQFSVKTLQEMIPNLFQQIPTLTEEALLKAIQEKRQQLVTIKTHYPEFFQEKLQKWGTGHLAGAGSTAGVSLGKVQVRLRGRELKMTLAKDSVTSAENIGSGLAAMAGLLNTDVAPALGQQIGLDALNQMLALSGYVTRAKELIPALAMPLEAGAPLLDITQFVENKNSYTVGDRVLMGSAFQAQERPQEMNLSAGQQAELLRGISQIVAFYKDWETTAYEKTLGMIKAKDLVPEFDAEALNRPIFPKSDLFALSIANAAVVLKNITKKFSQVFVVGLNNEITWVNDYDFQAGETAVMAGVVDIQDGKRASIVKSEDVSRWILALSHFMKATDGIENTKSELLLMKDAQGTRPLDALLEARRQLRLLLIGMANFLSNQLLDQDGLIMKSMNLSDIGRRQNSEKSALDQALAIRALLAAAVATKVTLYQVSAIEIYYKMNYHLYNPVIRFYSVGSQARVMPLPTALEIVRALSDLKPLLPPASQKQLAWILQPWLSGLPTLY